MASDNLKELRKALDSIARDLRAEVKLLDTTVTECACCERQTFENPTEYELARGLETLAANTDALALSVTEAITAARD